MQKAIPFVNILDQDFSWTWDGVSYSFRPKQTYLMEDWKAEHFAKHLVNHILNKEGKQVSDPSRDAWLSKILPMDGGIEAEDAEKLRTDLLNQVPVQPTEVLEAAPLKKKPGPKPKAKKLDEESFEGLQKPALEQT